MNKRNLWMRLALLVAILSSPYAANAQAAPTATQAMQLSAFGGLTGVFTGLLGGHNLSVTAGADLAFPKFFHVRPAIEVRGTYPIHGGTIDSQKSILAGPRFEGIIGRFHPYGDILIGRGGIDYPRGYYYNGFIYYSSNTNVYSGGGGLNYDLSPRVAVKADFQIQHWSTPVVPSGTIYSKPITFGVVYTFDFNPHHHKH
jgi:hypothetical protein